MKKAAAKIAAVLIIFGTPFVAAGIAHAAPEILTITPTSVKPIIKPGAQISGKFQVLNQGKEGYKVHIYSAPYSVKSEAYTPDFSSVPGSPAVASWLHFSATDENIKPGQTFTVHYTLSVPKGVQPGGYYAVAFAETQSPKPIAGVLLNEQVGEIFYIQVPGPVKNSGKLLTWSSPFLQKPPLKADLRLENDGGLHYFSNIRIVASDIFGNPKYTLTTQKVILPQTIRSIPASWDKSPSFGLFKVNGTATVLGKEQKLPTKYVLVMSQAVRKDLLIILVVLLLLTAAKVFYRKKGRKGVKR